MLTQQHEDTYTEFYDSTHTNEYLDLKTELLVGLAAAMAMNCQPCTRYYLIQAKNADISKGEISEVLAKVMAVSAGQKRLQMAEVLEKYEMDLDNYE
ncbi:MAG: carboxymuconolactone decarboxylase family protein [Gammaproteobacteria bacterium]|nr:carboxymuconolactone decarboxylase family protein [Gammaproteobacteria bacterium]